MYLCPFHYKEPRLWLPVTSSSPCPQRFFLQKQLEERLQAASGFGCWSNILAPGSWLRCLPRLIALRVFLPRDARVSSQDQLFPPSALPRCFWVSFASCKMGTGRRFEEGEVIQLKQGQTAPNIQGSIWLQEGRQRVKNV